MTRDERFAAAMTALAEVFPQRPLTDQRIELYAQVLADLPIEQIEHAARHAMRECRWMPTPAELRSFVEPSADDAALVAWSGFQAAASDVGAWASLVVDDACAAAALEAVFGSWPSFCELDVVAIGARRNEFLAAYRTARRGIPGGQAVLRGLCDRGWAGQLTVGGSVKRLPDVTRITEGRALPEARKAPDDEGA